MAYRNHRNAASRPSIYQTVTDRILSSLKSGVIPWENLPRSRTRSKIPPKWEVSGASTPF